MWRLMDYVAIVLIYLRLDTYIILKLFIIFFLLSRFLDPRTVDLCRWAQRAASGTRTPRAACRRLMGRPRRLALRPRSGGSLPPARLAGNCWRRRWLSLVRTYHYHRRWTAQNDSSSLLQLYTVDARHLAAPAPPKHNFTCLLSIVDWYNSSCY